MHIRAVVCEIWIENKTVQNLQFRGDCDHPSHEKVVFTIDAKIGNTIIVLPLDNPLYALEKTPCTHVWGVPLSSRIDNSWAVKMFYKSTCAVASRKLIGRVSNRRFQVMDWRYWLTLEWKPRCQIYFKKAGFTTMQVNPTCSATAPRRKILLNLLGSELVPSFVITYNLCCPPSLANILLRQWFSNVDMPLVPYMCFYPRGCIKFNPDHCCNLDTKAP